MSDDLYQKAILRLAASAHGAGRLEGDCCTGREANAMCGDAVIFDARLDADGRIREVANDLKGCVLVQASASLLAEHVIGQSPDDVARLRDDVTAMLNGGDIPDREWSAYEIFKPAMEYRSRHSCVLLPIDALAKALANCPKAE